MHRVPHLLLLVGLPLLNPLHAQEVLPLPAGSLAADTFSQSSLYMPLEQVALAWTGYSKPDFSISDPAPGQEFRMLAEHELIPKPSILSVPGRTEPHPLQAPPTLQWLDKEYQVRIYQEKGEVAVAAFWTGRLETDFFITNPILAGVLKHQTPVVKTITSGLLPGKHNIKDPLLSFLLFLLGEGGIAYRFNSETDGIVYVCIDSEGNQYLISKEYMMRIFSLYSLMMLHRVYPEVFGPGLGGMNSDAPEKWRQQMRIVPPYILGLLRRLIEEYDKPHIIRLWEQLSDYGKQAPRGGKGGKKKPPKKAVTTKEPPEASQPEHPKAETGSLLPGHPASSLSRNIHEKARSSPSQPGTEDKLYEFSDELWGFLRISEGLNAVHWEDADLKIDHILLAMIKCLSIFTSVYIRPLNPYELSLARRALKLSSQAQPDDIHAKLISPVLDSAYQLFSWYYRALNKQRQNMVQGKPGCIPSPVYFMATIDEIRRLSLLCTSPRWQSLFSSTDCRPMLAATCGRLISLLSEKPQPALKISDSKELGFTERKWYDMTAIDFPYVDLSGNELVRLVSIMRLFNFWHFTLLEAPSITVSPEHFACMVEGALHGITACMAHSHFLDATVGLDCLYLSWKFGQGMNTLLENSSETAELCQRSFQVCMDGVLRLAPDYINKPHHKAMELFIYFTDPLTKMLDLLEKTPNLYKTFAPCRQLLSTVMDTLVALHTDKKNKALKISEELEDLERLEASKKANDNSKLSRVQQWVKRDFDKTPDRSDPGREDTCATAWEVHMQQAHQQYQQENLEQALDHLHNAIISTSNAEFLIKSYGEQVLMQAQQLESQVNIYKIYRKKMESMDARVAAKKPQSTHVIPIPLQEQDRYYQQALVLVQAVSNYADLLKEVETSIECLEFHFSPALQSVIEHLSEYLGEVIDQIRVDQQWLVNALTSTIRTMITLDVMEAQLRRSDPGGLRMRQLLKGLSRELIKKIALNTKVWQSIDHRLGRNKTSDASP